MSIKKLNSPSTPNGPVPEVYLNRNTIEQLEQIEPPVIPLANKNTIPQSTVHNYNLKKMKSFKNIRKQYKQKNQLDVFLTDMNIVMKEFNTKDFYLDNELLIHVTNIAESFFIYGSKTERDQMKNEAILTLMLPYYRDEQILNIMRVTIWQKVKKTNIFKRIFKRLSNKFFLNVVKRV